jgi:hypothetical protein
VLTAVIFELVESRSIAQEVPMWVAEIETWMDMEKWAELPLEDDVYRVGEEGDNDYNWSGGDLVGLVF